MIDILEDGDDMDRFPAGTSLNDVTDYEFDLKFKGKAIMSFTWADYGGGILEDMGELTGNVYDGLERSIEQSSALCVFIDGAQARNDISATYNYTRSLENQNYAESNKWFFFKNKNKIRNNEYQISKNEEAISEYNDLIESRNKRIEQNERELEYFRGLLKEVGDQLLSDSKDFVTIRNGEKIKFRTEAI